MAENFTSEIYSDWMRSTQEKKYKEILLDFIIPLRGKIDLENSKIADIGIGKGWFEKKAVESGFDINTVGLDIEKMDMATDRIDLVVGSGDYIPFKDSSFDVVLSFDTVHLLKKPWEIERILSEGGHAIISTHCNERNFKRKGDKVKSLFDLEVLKEGLVGDPDDEMSYVVLFRNGSVV